jgi:hypothetical protein
LLAAAVENRRNNGRERQSGGGSIYNASNGLSLNPFFLVVAAENGHLEIVKELIK